MPARIALPAEADTEALGRRLAPLLQASEALCLSGGLGVGKSCLARALIRALTTPDEEAPSPTFTLVQTYAGPEFEIAHFDLYRLEDPEEAWEIGLEEALEQGAALIEWPERLEGRLPADRLDLELRVSGAGRTARLTGHGAWKERVE
ncbi:MAG: tRNA (adenosine(37)-N6)-threonylcarbamoyltransferase complex ATPase subunit type 1 TsaE [Phenylobacterium sp.]|nr:tRNA (adenosine(37)-N6)-threonylcarbamoyltransferase complex ATPase subunit type 1 TsaE [Phenylobacterium sp.]MCA3723717.1 tRNA (adenosine(37)-N6)-threonylcarbamoyltransferase complex ATPase subunit type 1 TsaE [Phenylobacterium sp.]MCA3726222.1 tRNA (adenosine(37)-N6)-threonylcarbamoyltransferase complex ATPase subunit type 1 TsaE [Phenylobacterium sp.]MCA6241383.1 tRNA (adenosine(37)-N6)-threonylcarbamoyltransferase complex ATPase subunit type 1 TsaE [Phenylobacterium sp.]MCA6247055.1 tRNA